MPRPAAPTTLALPPFAGATRQLILANLAGFFLFALLPWLSPRLTAYLLEHLALLPVALVHGQLWQPFTYSFLNLGLVSTAFGLLALWFAGSWLEGAFGPRWLLELYFVSAIGGAILAAALSFTRLFGLSPGSLATGLYAGLFGLFLGIARYFGDQEILLFFVLRLKARYMVAIYILVYLALLLSSNQRFDALVQLSAALAAFLYLRFAPRRGLAFGVTESLYGLRNRYYRSKRRRAARKFEVYMGKQGREVRFDQNGRYIDPDKDPNDRSWMN